jgi:hypothetical protein
VSQLCCMTLALKVFTSSFHMLARIGQTSLGGLAASNSKSIFSSTEQCFSMSITFPNRQELLSVVRIITRLGTGKLDRDRTLSDLRPLHRTLSARGSR